MIKCKTKPSLRIIVLFYILSVFPFISFSQENAGKDKTLIIVTPEKIDEKLRDMLGASNQEAYFNAFMSLVNGAPDKSADCYDYTKSPIYTNENIVRTNPFDPDKTRRENFAKYINGDFARYKEKGLIAISGGPYRKFEVNADSSKNRTLFPFALNYFIFENNMEGILHLLAHENTKALADFDFSMNLCRNIAGVSTEFDNSMITILDNTLKWMSYFQWLQLKPEQSKEILNTLNYHKEFNNREFFYLGEIFQAIVNGLKATDAMEDDAFVSTGVIDSVYSSVKSLMGDKFYSHVTLPIANSLLSAYYGFVGKNYIIKNPDNIKGIEFINKNYFDGKVLIDKVPEIRKIIKKIADEEEYFNRPNLLLSAEEIKQMTYPQKISVYSQLSMQKIPGFYHAPENAEESVKELGGTLIANRTDIVFNRFHLLKSALAAKIYQKSKGILPGKSTDLLAEGLVDEVALPFDTEVKFLDLYKTNQLLPEQADKIIVMLILNNIRTAIWDPSEIIVSLNALKPDFQTLSSNGEFRILVSGKNIDRSFLSVKESLKFFSGFIEIKIVKDPEIKNAGYLRQYIIDCKFKRPASFSVAYTMMPENISPLDEIIAGEKKKYNEAYKFIMPVDFTQK